MQYFCHGDFGNLEILRQFSGRYTSLNQIIAKTENQLLSYFQKNSFDRGISRGVEAIGLMIGLSGIGYGMLQCQYGVELPSIRQTNVHTTGKCPENLKTD